jgi:RNA polymerase sigma factor (sigma-70 family)
MTPLLAQRPRSDRGFERLYKRHVGDVYRYALAVMRNPTDAEDVTQTTFLNAYRAYVEKGSRPDKPQNWLIAIAHNVCRQRFRQTARRPSEVSFEDDIADTVTDDDALSAEDIRRALGHLAFNQRAALVMRELEGRSYAEIAEILEVSTSAVETLIFRARRALREQLEGSLTCGEAEFAISRQLDGRLPRGERGQLRAHLRECSECAGFARRQRAQRGALKTLALVPVPSSLMSLFGGGGGAAVGTGLTLKAAAALTAGLAIGGASYEGVHHVPWQAERPTAAAAQNRIGGIAAARDAAFASRGTSRVTPDAGARGHAAKTKSVKPKKAKTHGRANQSALARKNASLASHGRRAEQSSQARLAGGARVHPTTRVKPKDLRLPGPIGERPAHRHGKKK